MKTTMGLVAIAMSVFVSAVALADDTVSFEEGAFAAKIEAGKPTGDAAEIATAGKATYFVVVKNGGAPTQITLVWKLDGTEVQRQTLDVGSSSRWRTWGSRPLGSAKLIEVQIVEAGGTVLKEDKLELPR